MTDYLPSSLLRKWRAEDFGRDAEEKTREVTSLLQGGLDQARNAMVQLPPRESFTFGEPETADRDQRVDVGGWSLPPLSAFLGRKAEPEQVQAPQSQPSQYSGALTTLGGSPEAESVTQVGGAGYVGDAGPLEAMSGAYDPSNATRHQKLTRIGQVARSSGLDDEGARILQAVATTEGGLEGAIGDNGQSRGPYQFYEGGQMPAFRAWLKANGIQGDPNALVNDVDLATRFAASTYLGAAIARGRAQGLSGSDLATYVQETGQVSVDPWKTGDNYRALFGGGQDPFATTAPVDPRAAANDMAAPGGADAGGDPAIANVGSGAPQLGTIKGGLSVAQAQAADRNGGMAYRTEVPYASDESGIIYPGDEPLQSVAPAQPDPEAGAYYSSPADTSLTALPPAQTSDAVEPAAAAPSADVAPASLGDRIKRAVTSFGDALVDALTPSKDGMQQAAQDIQQRQATMTDPGGPMPFEQLQQGIASTAGKVLPGLDPEANQRFWIDDPQRMSALFQKFLDKTITPDEETELFDSMGRQGQVIGVNTPEAPRGRGVPGVVGEAQPRPAADTTPSMGIVSRETAADAGQQYDRYYHGTGSDFARPDPGKFDPNGLFGPGYYVTSDARVAGSPDGGYAIQRGGAALSIDDVRAMVARTLQDDSLGLSPSAVARAQDLLLSIDNGTYASYYTPGEAAYNNLASIVRTVTDDPDKLLGYATSTGANIRPVDVPRGLKLADAKLDRGWASDTVIDAAERRANPNATEADLAAARQDIWRLAQYRPFYNALEERYRDRALINGAMADAGWDGIKYEGGQIRPMTDEAGNAIEHTALVIFPESLDKIRNATAGTPGGLLPGASGETQPTLGTAARMAKDALGGGVAGGYEASQQEGATPESIAQGALQGAGMGVGRGLIRDQLRPAQMGQLARAVRNQPWQSPYDGQQPPGPASNTQGLPVGERARRAFVRAWTDDKVDLAEVQRQAQEFLNRPLEANEMPTELSRRNPLAAAEANIKSGPFRDAVQSVGQDVDTLDEVLTYRDMIDVANATGNPNRRFSGGITAQEAQQRLDWYANNVDPQRWATIDGAANQIRGWVDEYRQRMLDAGVWSQGLYTELRQRYPNYVPTRIMDYMQDPNNITVGKSLSLRDRGLRRLTEEGTTRERERPLASLIRYAVEAENVIAKNQTYNAFVNLANEAPGMIPLRPVPANYTRQRGEAIITGFENGVRTTYATTAPIAAAVQMEASKQIPFLSTATALFRELITRSPVFVAGQIPLDAMSYMIRETARESGNAPRVALELARAYRDAFQGLGSGRVTGDLYRAIREGGGMAGLHDRSARAMATTLDDVTRRNMLEIRNAGDVQRLLKWVATAEWSQAVGQRVEMAPRLAAARLGEARALRQGANVDRAALQGVMDFRDVTLDFQRGGTWARTINQAVPFFNVGWQSAATVQRAWRENPRAFPLTALALIGAPAAAAEAWNRSDSQREKDYEDVPDYVKDRGIVYMLPGAESVDAQGNRRPQYALIPLRELAPFAIVAREATAKAMGKDTRGFGALLGASVSAASPIQANNPGDFFNTFTPFGASTGVQLATNRDLFRNRDIATDRNDSEAASLSQGLASLFGGRPSQWEFAIRDVGGYAGASALAASDMVTGRERPSSGGPQDLPVVGGLAKRFVGNSIGQNLQDAKDAMLSEPVKRAISEAGMRDDQVSAARGEIEGLKLTREEQARYQTSMNQYLERETARLVRLPAWRAASKEEREQELRMVFSEARENAKDAAFRGMKPADIERRFRQQDKKAS